MNTDSYKVGDEGWDVVDTRLGPKLVLFQCTSLSPKGKAAHWRSPDGRSRKRTDNPDTSWCRFRKTRAGAVRHYVCWRIFRVQTQRYREEPEEDHKDVADDIISAINQATRL